MTTPDPNVSSEATFVASAKCGDRDAFHRLIEPHRRALQLHGYRMLGSFHDAEDVVQETLLRAWRGIERFDGRASIRYWLYRIATNVCLNCLATRPSAGRILPEMQGPPSERMPDREPAADILWLEPYPDSALENLPDAAPGPDARYEMRESVHLAFIAAIQLLPPRQRAALLLHDVLGWSAAEIAGLLGSSVTSVNSALQRARATLEQRLPTRPSRASAGASDRERALIDQYVRAWESSDVNRFAALLREDAVMSMPPWRQWYIGRPAITTFFAGTARPGGHAPFRLVRTAANCQLAFAFYSRWQDPEWQFHSIQLLELEGNAIAKMTSFVSPTLSSVFGLPTLLESRGS